MSPIFVKEAREIAKAIGDGATKASLTVDQITILATVIADVVEARAQSPFDRDQFMATTLYATLSKPKFDPAD